jgi:hypothetical protein
MNLQHLLGGGRLDEMTWRDRSPLIPILEANRGRWIHFSQMPKLGVNPKKIHDDPIGIYFYPVDFLLTNYHRVESGDQFGLSWPYYFLCDIDLDDTGLTLSKVTQEQIQGLAERNGWMPLLQAYEAADEEQRKTMTTSYGSAVSPGAFLWSFLDLQQKEKRISWNKAFKGLSYILDDGNSIIHNYEPSQILVFNPKILRNVTLGDNKAGDALQAHKTDKKEGWIFALKMIFDTVVLERGGKVIWKDKLPEIHLTSGNSTFRFYFSSWGQKIYCEYKTGRIKGSKNFKLRDRQRTEVVADCLAVIDEALGTVDELDWNPIVSEADATDQLRSLIFTRGSQAQISTEVENGAHPRMYITADHETKASRKVTILARSFFSINPESASQNVSSIINDKSFISAEVNSVDPSDPSAAIIDLAAAFEKRLRGRYDYMGPGSRSYSRAKFYYQDEWSAFLGWFVLNCGFSFNGTLEERFTTEIEAYHNTTNKAALMKEIAKVLKDHIG